MGNGSFSEESRYDAGSSPQYIAVADLNNDNRLDIVVANWGSYDVSVFFGQGNGGFVGERKYAAGYQPICLVIGDLNHDKRLDLVVANAGSNNVNIMLSSWSVAFEKKTMLLSGNGSRPQSLVITDFNNDGLADVGVVNSASNNIGIFLSQGNISFTDQLTYAIGPYTSPCAISAGDFDNDTRIDVAVGICHSQNIAVLLGYGNGSFGNLVVYSTGSISSQYSLAVNDIDGDGTIDIVIANYDSNNFGVLLGYGNGTFASIVLFPLEFGSNPFSIVIGDFNKDRKLDIAVANNGSDSLSILLQTC